jgi:hypothetical protein
MLALFPSHFFDQINPAGYRVKLVLAELRMLVNVDAALNAKAGRLGFGVLLSLETRRGR